VKVFTRSALLLAVLSCSRPARAQDLRPYVSAAIDISPVGIHSWSGSPSLSYTNATDDTVVMGILGEGGVPLGSNTAFGVEINIPFRRTDITQTHGYFNPYRRLSRYQEWTLFGLFHGYLATSRRVRAGILAGGGFVFASSLDRISSCNFDVQIPCSPFDILVDLFQYNRHFPPSRSLRAPGTHPQTLQDLDEHFRLRSINLKPVHHGQGALLQSSG
jgi:hypothetical protein